MNIRRCLLLVLFALIFQSMNLAWNGPAASHFIGKPSVNSLGQLNAVMRGATGAAFSAGFDIMLADE